MTDSLVTIVVSPRERFSFTRESLDSIYEHTDIPFDLVYVDSGSPIQIRDYLRVKAREKGFQLIRTDYYLSPNQARNLGLAQVSTRYVAFVENDMVVAPGWLHQLIQCAETTGATVVSPLICQGRSLHQEIHCAGGEALLEMNTESDPPAQQIRDKLYRQGQQVVNVRNQLQQHQTGLAEFHCILVRRSIFEQIGPFDEGLFSTREHVDFCLLVAKAGGTIYFEPASIATYISGAPPGPPLEWSDIPYYMLRWSDAWELASLNRLRDKWGLREDDYFRSRYKRLGWRRKLVIIRPLAQRLTFGRTTRSTRQLEKILMPVDKVLNWYLTNRYAQSQRQRSQAQATAQSQKLLTATTSSNN